MSGREGAVEVSRVAQVIDRCLTLVAQEGGARRPAGAEHSEEIRTMHTRLDAQGDRR